MKWVNLGLSIHYKITHLDLLFNPFIMAEKIISLPKDNIEEAKKLLKEALDSDKILFIVLGDTGIAKETVRKADIITGGDELEPHWVLHAPKREEAQEMLEALEDPGDLVPDWSVPLAIAVSLTDKIRAAIPRDGAIPNNRKIDDAFLAAEEDED